MSKILFGLVAILFFWTFPSFARDFEQDTIPTTAGDLIITFVGHGSLIFQFQGKIIHVDPVSRLADYSRMPNADLILITHHHGDHPDKKALDLLRSEKTEMVYTELCAGEYPGGTVMHNGEQRTILGLTIQAVPAYNILHKRSNGQPFHVKGEGNGYVISFADKRVYLAGDTENIPEMKELKNIDIAFLPMNLPYTMTPEMVATAVQVIHPAILYPYHYGNTDTSKLIDLLKDMKDLEIRIRKMS